MGVDQSIFRAYDIRGIYPDQIDESVAKKIAQAYVAVMKPQGKIVVGYDVRLHSRTMADAVIEGLTESGVDVVSIGLAPTDMNYFAIGNYGYAGGIQVTASHNPAEWHGLKLTGAGVKPLTGDKEIAEIKQVVLTESFVPNVSKKGTIEERDIIDDYCDFLMKYLGPVSLQPMKVVVNANFGYAGKVFEYFIHRAQLPIELVPLNCEPDGHFPKGRPDPFIMENRTELVELVKSTKADLGIAWDADADRVFFCADGGTFIEPYHFNTLLIRDVLNRYPAAAVVYDLRYIWGLVESIVSHGGKPVMARVGHSYIKAKMREVDAVFGAESSGHTYYKDYWYADSGMLPVVQLLRILAAEKKPLSVLVGDVADAYPISGEINRKVSDPGKVIAAIKAAYHDGTFDETDGLTVTYDDYRFNVRLSNNEPVFRLNLEAKTHELVVEKTKEILESIPND